MLGSHFRFLASKLILITHPLLSVFSSTPLHTHNSSSKPLSFPTLSSTTTTNPLLISFSQFSLPTSTRRLPRDRRLARRRITRLGALPARRVRGRGRRARRQAAPRGEPHIVQRDHGGRRRAVRTPWDRRLAGSARGAALVPARRCRLLPCRVGRALVEARGRGSVRRATSEGHIRWPLIR